VSEPDDGFDVVIIGGGITGVSLALESAERGMRPLLLERRRFGAATSANSLRIIHGGMRYLQTLDLARFRESVREQAWFLAAFPDFVRPLECLMPLYGEGARRPGVFRTAVRINRALRRVVLGRVDPLPHGTVLDADAAAAAVPALQRQGLRGAGVWYDAQMINDHLLDHLLERAVTAGAVAMAEAKVTALQGGARVTGVEVGTTDGSQRHFATKRVVNAAGPWADGVARHLTGRRLPAFALTLAFNLVLDRKPIAECAVVVRDPKVQQNFFLLPSDGRTVAGTWYEPWASNGDVDDPRSAAESAAATFLDALNRALPSLKLTASDIVAVQPGLLPALSEGSRVPLDHAIVHDHRALGGPTGLFSVIGIKYTTARATARRALRVIGA
jgi:glycerol-3-phosphate dehydrogenase